MKKKAKPSPPESEAISSEGDQVVDPAETLNDAEKAVFEKVMGEVGQATGDKIDPADADDTIDPSSPLTEAEQAKLDAVIDGLDKTDGADAAPADDDELDDDQQKAFESIMAQIEKGDADKGGTGADDGGGDAEDGSGISKLQAPVDDESSTVSPETVDRPDQDDDASSDDIEAILKEITAEDQAATVAAGDSPTGPASDVTTTPPSSEPPVEIGQPETAAADPVLDHAPEPDDRQPPSGVPASTPTAPPESSATAGESHAAASPDKPPAKAERAKPLPEASVRSPRRPSSRRRKWMAMTVSLVLLAALGFAGYHFWLLNKPDEKVLRPLSTAAPSTAPVPPENTPEASETQPPSPTAEENSALTAIVDELNRLRSRLTDKQREIEALSGYYRSGIDGEIKAIVQAIQQAGKGKPSYTAATAEPRISLGLSAIQRRRIYILKLASPEDHLYQASEALLYFIRKAELLSMMARKTSDIDIDGFVEQAMDEMAAQRTMLEHLDIDSVEVSPPSLASIWQEIEKRLAHKIDAADKSAANTDNADIWTAICAGDFSRRDQLTALSPQAAGCLATWKGKDLFLNNLTELTPDAAAELSRWNGEWLGLNGLTELSPEVAEHLARWKGRGLSLNGLSRLSPRVAAILSEWQGEQIELIHVKHMAHWENPNTRLFFSEGLQRKQHQARN